VAAGCVRKTETKLVSDSGKNKYILHIYFCRLSRRMHISMHLLPIGQIKTSADWSGNKFAGACCGGPKKKVKEK
jgi:hypothetical protein